VCNLLEPLGQRKGTSSISDCLAGPRGSENGGRKDGRRRQPRRRVEGKGKRKCDLLKGSWTATTAGKEVRN